MSLHELSLEAATPGERRLRDVAAALLRLLSHTLGLLAERVAPPPAAAPVEPLLEFHAEAGAPEGALYADGQLIAQLDGVRRL